MIAAGGISFSPSSQQFARVVVRTSDPAARTGYDGLRALLLFSRLMPSGRHRLALKRLQVLSPHTTPAPMDTSDLRLVTFLVRNVPLEFIHTSR